MTMIVWADWNEASVRRWSHYGFSFKLPWRFSIDDENAWPCAPVSLLHSPRWIFPALFHTPEWSSAGWIKLMSLTVTRSALDKNSGEYKSKRSAPVGTGRVCGEFWITLYRSEDTDISGRLTDCALELVKLVESLVNLWEYTNILFGLQESA